MNTDPADRRDTPLCPLWGHLARKGGEGRMPGRRVPATYNHVRFEDRTRMLLAVRRLSYFLRMRHTPLSPLAGEMPAPAGRGGYTAPAPPSACRFEQGAPEMPHQEVTRNLRQNARRLRSDMTDAEKTLWQAIRAHRLEGTSFRRQMPIEGYIVDFAAPAYRVIVELDGSQHAQKAGLERDQKRDQRLVSLGWTVLRFWNEEVTSGLDGVCRKILDACGKETC